MRNTPKVPEVDAGNRHPLTSKRVMQRYTLAGRAMVTLQNLRTKRHHTYLVEATTDQDRWWVYLLVDGGVRRPVYIGTISRRNHAFYSGGDIHWQASPVYAFMWWWRKVHNGSVFPDNLRIWSSGRCARCAQKLSHPDSIARGIGPKCWPKVRSKIEIRPRLLVLAAALDVAGYASPLWAHAPDHLSDIPAEYMAPILRMCAGGGVTDLYQALELLHQVAKEEDPEQAVKAMAGVVGHLAIHAVGKPDDRKALRKELLELGKPDLPGWWLPDDPL